MSQVSVEENYDGNTLLEECISETVLEDVTPLDDEETVIEKVTAALEGFNLTEFDVAYVLRDKGSVNVGIYLKNHRSGGSVLLGVTRKFIDDDFTYIMKELATGV